MISLSAAARRRRLLLVPVCLAAIILGILAMHALNRHASMPTHGIVHQSITTAMGPATPAGHAATVAAPDEGQSTTDELMLCAAMLLGAAGGILLALRRRQLTIGGLRLPRLRQPSAGIVKSRVGTGPPYVWEFSVIRC